MYVSGYILKIMSIVLAYVLSSYCSRPIDKKPTQPLPVLGKVHKTFANYLAKVEWTFANN